jgi:hypothetical protein
MSRGIGKTQQRILDELASIEPPKRDWLLIVGGSLTVMELAERLGIPDRQVRRAVRALEDRGLVVITRGISYHGIGEYGPLVRRKWMFSIDTKDLPTAKVLKAGEPWPWRPGYVASRDTELVHIGIPSPALEVWLPENRVSYLEQRLAGAKRGRAALQAEYERLTAPPPTTTASGRRNTQPRNNA